MSHAHFTLRFRDGFKAKSRIRLVPLLVLALSAAHASTPEADFPDLAGAFLADTPLIYDLQVLSDEIGGRITGSAANERAIDWATERFREIGISVLKESFSMERRWLPKSATVEINGENLSFSPRVVAAPFSTPSPPGGISTELIYAGRGREEDFRQLGESVAGAFVLVETSELSDEDGLLEGLFVQYAHAREIESTAFGLGAAGLIYMSTRPKGLLYRHRAALGAENIHPMLTMEREGAQRAIRILKSGKKLTITADVDVAIDAHYPTANVVAEIPGSDLKPEIVLLGAHLDSWDLGTGALDNGANIAAVIDIARQIKRLGLQPRRTMRFVLFNGEEQGLLGSLAYVRRHEQELDRHVIAMAMDLGSGSITGFFINGRPELEPLIQRLLMPVEGLGPFPPIDELATGTDTLDFTLQGIATTVPFQAAANYPSNYHAESDTFDKVDQKQLRLNTSVLGTLFFGFAQTERSLRRHDREEIQSVIDALELTEVQRASPPWQGWFEGSRGRRPD